MATYTIVETITTNDLFVAGNREPVAQFPKTTFGVFALAATIRGLSLQKHSVYDNCLQKYVAGTVEELLKK